jgi:predicted ATPase
VELSKEESERRQKQREKREKSNRKASTKEKRKKTYWGREREKPTGGGEREKAFVGVKDKIIRGRRKIRWGLGEKKLVGLGGARWGGRWAQWGRWGSSVGLGGAGGGRWRLQSDAPAPCCPSQPILRHAHLRVLLLQSVVIVWVPIGIG